MSAAAAGAPAVVGALPSGASPWTLARRRLLRNRVAMAMLGVFVVDRRCVCLAAPLYAHDVAHTDPFRSNLDGTTIVNGKRVPVMAAVDQRARPRRDADRPDLGSAPLLPRRRRAGTRRRGAAPLRRAQLAADRVLRGADHLPGRARRSGSSPASSAASSTASSRALLDDRLGVPRLPARDLPLDGPDRRRSLVVGPFRLESGSLVLPIAIIGIVYIPYVARPIRGEVLSLRRREFVEAGDRPRRVDGRLLRKRHPPERRHDGDRLLPARDGDRDADRGGALVPLDRRPAAERELGHDHPGRATADLHAPGRRARARASRSRSRCSRSTCSATASATRSTRARSSGGCR